MIGVVAALLMVLPSPPQPVGVPGHWTVELSQNGAQIRRQWDQTLHGASCVTDGRLRVAGTVLDMTTSGRAGNCAEVTYQRRMWQYGVYQAEIKAPFRNGHPVGWWAFWLPGQPESIWPAGGEIDVAEMMHGQVCPGYHWKTATGGVGTSGDHCQPLTPGWHAYAVRWSPHRLTFYYDGRVVLRLRGSYIVANPVYARLDITTARNGPAATVQVRDVRIWKGAKR